MDELALPSSKLSEVEERLRSGWGGIFSPFLEPNVSLEALLEGDARTVANLGLTMRDFSLRLNDVFHRHWEELPGYDRSDHDFVVSPPCPLCETRIALHPVPHTAEIVLIRCDKVKRANEIAREHGQRSYTKETFPQLISECGALILPELFRHSIECHGFFGGAYPYRVEPEILAAAIGVVPTG